MANKEFTFDVDVSKLPCGINGALYFSQMSVVIRLVPNMVSAIAMLSALMTLNSLMVKLMLRVGYQALRIVIQVLESMGLAARNSISGRLIVFLRPSLLILVLLAESVAQVLTVAIMTRIRDIVVFATRMAVIMLLTD